VIFAAIDWAEQQHMLVVLDADGRTLEKTRVPHTAPGFGALGAILSQHASSPGDVAVAMEWNEGPLVDWLFRQDYRVFGINPKSAERARDRFTPAGLKDDERDAWALAEFLRTSHQHLRPLRPDSERTTTLRAWVRLREDLMQERTVQIQRLRSHLVTWHPHLLRAIKDLSASWALDLLEKTPTADSFAKLTRSTIERFAHGRRLRLITKDRILTEATYPSPNPRSAHDEAHTAEVCYRACRIRELNRQLRDIDRRLGRLIDHHPDTHIFRSLPVAGAVTTATFLAGFGEDRDRWDGHEELTARWGSAPVTIQSGKHCRVKRRRARDATVHQAWLWFSFNTVRRKDCWARGYYQEKRRSGTSHYTALRCTAQRWIKIVHRLWQDRVPYDEQLHQARRHERQQPRNQK
jgi:transposase